MGVPVKRLCKFAYAVQAAEGTAKLAADMVLLPLPAGESLKDDFHKEVIDYADGIAGDRDYVEKGRWVEGDVQVPMLPGYLGDLLDWTLTRDSEAQAQFATLWVDLTNSLVRKYYDAKVASARFHVAPPSHPELTLTVRAKKIDDDNAETFAAATLPEVSPYQARNVTFSIDPDGASPVLSCTLKEFTVEIDNRLMSGEDGMRICPYETPQYLDNGGHPRVTGTISEDFRSTALYDAWLAGAEGSITCVLARTVNTTTYTATLTLPRIFYPNSGHPNISDGDDFLNNEVPFHALWSMDGETAAITFAEV